MVPNSNQVWYPPDGTKYSGKAGPMVRVGNMHTLLGGFQQPVCITLCCLGSCLIIAHGSVYGGYGYPLASLSANAIIAFIVVISLHLINSREK
jgi:hypothetical protein